MESSEHRIKFIEQNGAKSTVLSSEFRIEFRVQNRVQSKDESLRIEYNTEYRIMSELKFTFFSLSAYIAKPSPSKKIIKNSLKYQ